MMNVYYSVDLCWNMFLRVCSLWLRHGSERLLYEERGISVPPGLPEASWHDLQQLQGICGGWGGDGPREDLPSRLLRLHHLQVSLKSPRLVMFWTPLVVLKCKLPKKIYKEGYVEIKDIGAHQIQEHIDPPLVICCHWRTAYHQRVNFTVD